jgi:streptogramin lyase
MDIQGTWKNYAITKSIVPNDLRVLDFSTRAGKAWVGLELVELQVNRDLVSSTSRTFGFLLLDRGYWTVYPIEEMGLRETPHSLRQLTCDHMGRLWFFIPQDILCCFDGEKCVTYSAGERGLPPDLTDLNLLSNPFAHDMDGNLWMALGSKGLYRFDGISWRRLAMEDWHLGEGLVTKVTVDLTGQVFFAMQQQRTTQFAWHDGKQCGVYAIAQVGFEEAAVQALAVDNKGRLLVGWEQSSNGLWVFEPKEGQFRILTAENSILPGNEIMSVAVDKTGRSWVGVFGAGAAILYENQAVYWKEFSTSLDQGLDRSGDSNVFLSYDIRSDDRAQIWVRSYDGVNEGICTFQERRG